MIRFLIFLSSATAILPLYLTGLAPSHTQSSYREPVIAVNNRILARVNGKPISTLDLTKKMDLAFFKAYPEYAHSLEARVEFYNHSWRFFLEEWFDKELILADAKESKITVSQGDVRQEIEEIFGPNVVENLDKAGLNLEEATQLVQEEMTITRMLGGRAHAQAIRDITPQKVYAAYLEYLADPKNAPLAQWTYRILTIKDPSKEKAVSASDAATALLDAKTPLTHIVHTIQGQKLLSEKGSLSLSEPMTQNEKEISPQYLELLVPLEPGQHSQPFLPKQKQKRLHTYRILILEEKVPPLIPPFETLEAKLKDSLINQRIDQESDAYIARLRRHYHTDPKQFEADLPASYQPFSLKERAP